ncbi:leucine rich repeat protein, putative [Eimeria tenella]|uniref:Leucine rich repeat protein, putative n=1 Tax=Eimeria tenella TaxID=5802 RepID=U6KMH1_EIMTE|nr:leucine rich repeat protein, putative [Eimeria tenella]CDJ37467.1 leucine rich repeat protein, putative [Eimeria tenella]|eukprot:XP_013228305.1 leucine rich repeat protein, putative [Eimeria tenella]
MKVGIAELELHSKKFFRLSPQHTLSEILTDKVCCVFVSGRLAFTLDSFSDPGQIVATFQLPRCATNIAALDEKHLSTLLIDVDVHPKYLRVTVKGKTRAFTLTIVDILQWGIASNWKLVNPFVNVKQRSILTILSLTATQ